MARNCLNADEVLELIFGDGSDLEDEGSEDDLEDDQSESELCNFDELPSANDSFTEGLVHPPPPCDRPSRLISDRTVRSLSLFPFNCVSTKSCFSSANFEAFSTKIPGGHFPGKNAKLFILLLGQIWFLWCAAHVCL